MISDYRVQCPYANQKIPEDFNFSLTYGTYGNQKIDTFNNVVVKDLVEDGTIEASISLTKKEKQAIYGEMMKIDIMGELNLDEKTKKKSVTTNHPRFRNGIFK